MNKSSEPQTHQAEGVNLVAAARSIPLAHRLAFIEALAETTLHQHLKRLLERKLPTAHVEITHGSNEYGKDLVLVDADGLSERVVAFVVKVGRVSGKSGGIVDQVASQVRQAIRHPAKLQSVIEPKEVKQVYVVVAGTVTSNAAERINAEVRGAVQDIWDSSRLVDEFTNNYPEVFFEAETLDFLQRRITELEAHPLFVRVAADRNLSDWFVDPFVSSSEPIDPVDLEKHVPGRGSTYAFVKLRDILAKKRRLLLIGAPGSGKSAIIAKLAVDTMREAFKRATQSREKDSSVPLLVTARQLLGYSDVEQLVAEQLGDVHDRKCFVVGTLLVDGLDEVKMEDRDRVLDLAREFSDQLGCSLIVTTRWTEAFREPVPGFHQVEVLEFKVNQALRLFEKIVPEGRLLTSLKEGLDLIQNQLHMTPLTLVLLIEVVREYREIPASVTELYDRYFDYALGRHDPDKGIEVLFGYQLKKAFLAELAHGVFYANDRLSVPRSDFVEFAGGFARRQGIKDTSRFLGELERANILRISEEVEFVHRSFLDYFVAWQLRRLTFEPEEIRSRLVDLYFNSRWVEVTFFWVGIAREADPVLLERILDYPEDSPSAQVMKLLCGRLLQAGWLAPLDVKLETTRRAISRAPPTRQAIIDFFTEDGDAPPDVLGDWVLLHVGGMSFGSSFLTESNLSILEELLNSPSADSLTCAVLLVGGLRNKLSADELSDVIDRTLEAIDRAKLDSSVELRLLSVFMMVADQDTERYKALQRRFRKLVSRYKELARVLFLPAAKRRLISSGRPPRR